MARIYENLADTVGNTPLVKIPRLNQGLPGTVLVKMESFNPAGSVKDRIGVAMIEAGERDGKLLPGMTIERRNLLKAYGAQVVLTPGADGMKGAIAKASEIRATAPNTYFVPQQFENPANPELHRRSTAEEILRDTQAGTDTV